MNILLVSLLKRSVTPEVTASRPRLIYELAKGLMANGHAVTILGTADSVVPGAKILSIIPKSFTELPPFENPFYAETSYLVQLSKKIEAVAKDFDVIHNHTYPEFINLFATERIQTPMVTTVHAQATDELDTALSLFPETTLVAISQAHKRGFKKAAILEVVYNGIDTNLYSFQEKKQDYLLWIGRLGKAKNSDGRYQDAKGVKWAIKAALQTGSQLKLSGNVEEKAFFDHEVKPFLSDTIEWVGNVSAEQPLKKAEVVTLMQNAKCFLMTVNWEEPFGLVMAEAMSCGTPVVGFKRGSVPEIIKDGVTGYVVDPAAGSDGLAQALAKIDRIDPAMCRQRVEANFSIATMVKQYESLYQKVKNK